MQLSHVDIDNAIQIGFIEIDPYDYYMVQPASVDLRLGKGFLIPIECVVDLNKPRMSYVEHSSSSYVIEPGGFVLGTTMEKITLGKSIAAKFEGKSSLGRIGLMTHVTAGFIDPGFSGNITVEICNVGPARIKLSEGDKIGQLVFSWLMTGCDQGYGSERWGSHYQNQTGTTGAQ